MDDADRNTAAVDAFLRVLDPADDATGGGTASAVVGALAAGLTGMVARLSAGRAELEGEEDFAAIDAEAQRLTDILFEGGRLDSEAFGAVMQAYRMPKEPESAKAERSAEIQRAMLGAAKVPLENAERCAEVFVLASRLEGRSNPNAASDLACALDLVHAAARGCLENVDINLGSIKDETARQQLAERAAAVKNAFSERESQRA
ncbi:MAG: cyclodeaminase/cyclohydrolase family protein [Gemmatimonadota bacterium]